MTTRSLLLVSITIFLWNSIGFAQTPDKNQIRFEAMSPYEDLTEYALEGDTASIKKSMAPLDEALTALRPVLTPQTLRTLGSYHETMRNAVATGDHPTIALRAVDSYKAIAEELDKSRLIIPMEVVLLDYVGFKIHALLKQKPIDWAAISAVAGESEIYWRGIKGSVADKGLRDSLDTAVAGIRTAVATQNIDMLLFAAQVDLDLVDLLEHYFEKKTP